MSPEVAVRWLGGRDLACMELISPSLRPFLCDDCIPPSLAPLREDECESLPPPFSGCKFISLSGGGSSSDFARRSGDPEESTREVSKHCCVEIAFTHGEFVAAPDTGDSQLLRSAGISE